MGENGFSLTRILPYKDRIADSHFVREKAVSKNPYSRIFYAVNARRTGKRNDAMENITSRMGFFVLTLGNKLLLFILQKIK